MGVFDGESFISSVVFVNVPMSLFFVNPIRVELLQESSGKMVGADRRRQTYLHSPRSLAQNRNRMSNGAAIRVFLACIQNRRGRPDAIFEGNAVGMNRPEASEGFVPVRREGRTGRNQFSFP